MNAAPIEIPLGPEELESFFSEIRLYLEAIEIFRSEGCEPHRRHERPRLEVLP